MTKYAKCAIIIKITLTSVFGRRAGVQKLHSRPAADHLSQKIVMGAHIKMKQEELNKLEVEKIEVIHDLLAEVRELNNNLIEATNVLSKAATWLNRTQPQNAPMPVTDTTPYSLIEKGAIYPDFAAWRRDAIKAQSGIVFAPSDLYVTDKNGNRRYHFTWDEAMQIERDILRPRGWRLPTVQEWRQAIAEFRRRDRLMNSLKLEYRGYFGCEDMRKCRETLDESLALKQGLYGYYWSSTSRTHNANNAFNLYFYSITVWPGMGKYNKNHGFAVRCVATQDL